MEFTDFAPQDVLNKLVNEQNTQNDIVWNNLHVRASKKQFSKKVPESSLTILTNESGITHCKVDGKDFKLCNATFLILNPYQELEYTIDSVKKTVRTQNIHFNYQFALDAFQSCEDILEEPHPKRTAFPEFFNELHYKDNTMQLALNSLNKLNTTDYSLTYANFLHFLISIHLKTTHTIQSFDCVKQRTKIELFKRVALAKDIIFSEFDTNLTIESISKRSMLSKYHLIRIFKATYGLSPYEMLKVVRLEKSKEYLKKTGYTIFEIAELVGYKEGNSLSNAFKTKYGIAPGQYRISNIE